MTIIDPEIFTRSLEETLIRGSTAWIATFKDFYRNYKLGGKRFLLYAEGDTYVKGFFLSRIFSFFLGPRRKAFFLVNHINKIDDDNFKKLIDICSEIGEKDDYIMLVMLTEERDIKGSIKRKLDAMKTGNVGVSIVSLSTGNKYYSNNFIGRTLKKILGDGLEISVLYGTDLFKAISIILIISLLIMTMMHIFNIIYIDFVTILSSIAISLILGYIFYKRVFHTTLTFTSDGFILKRGKWTYKGRWRDFKRSWVHVDKGEEYIRLESDDGYIDIPTRKIGLDKDMLIRFVEKKISN